MQLLPATVPVQRTHMSEAHPQTGRGPFINEGKQTVSTNHTTATTSLEYSASQSHKVPVNINSLPDAVEFRVIRPGVPVRRLRLTGNRYTFGSAEGCSIQLDDQGLRPMHAVLIRDAHRILVRAYSVPLEINGTRTTEAILQTGDVMRMGIYRFELLAAPGDTPAPVVQQSLLNQDSHQDHKSWQEQLRREALQWRSRQPDVDARENRIDQREAQLHGRESELWNRAEQLRQREAELISQESTLAHIRDDYDCKKQEVSRLLDENRVRQQEIDKRDEEYRALEAEYREYAAQAKQQLEQSQQQAQTATEAVQKMRDQFAALNEQLEDFSSQQRELEEARNKAIQAQAESEAKQQQAETRASEISAELDLVRKQQQDDQVRLNESTQAAENLRKQVEQLQQRINDADSQASQLRSDYEGALASVRQLELLVDQTTTKGQQDRADWVAETEQLRETVERLSVDLATANGELAELRQANELLTRRIADAEQQRDEAKAEARPSSELLETLRGELNSANERLQQMQCEHEVTVARLAQQREDDQLEAQRLLEQQREHEETIARLAQQREDDQLEAQRLLEQQREHEETIARLAQQREDDQLEAQRLLEQQRETDRQLAQQQLADALAERDAAAVVDQDDIVSDSPQPPAASDSAVDSEPLAGDQSLAAAAALGTIASMMSSDDANADSESPYDPSVTDQPVQDHDEGWPTYQSGSIYQSESIESQDPLGHVDSEIASSLESEADRFDDSDSSDAIEADTANRVEMLPPPSDWTSDAAELLTESESVVAEAEQSTTEDEPETTSLWRVESEQAVESSGHFSAWESEDQAVDPQREFAAQDGDVQWQDESPEVAVNEMIDDIEQNVGQVITDADSSDEAWNSVSELEDETHPDAAEDAMAEDSLSSWETTEPSEDQAYDAGAPAAEYHDVPVADDDEYEQEPGAEYEQEPASEYEQEPAAEYEQEPASEYEQEPAAEDQYEQEPAAEYDTADSENGADANDDQLAAMQHEPVTFDEIPDEDDASTFDSYTHQSDQQTSQDSDWSENQVDDVGESESDSWSRAEDEPQSNAHADNEYDSKAAEDHALSEMLIRDLDSSDDDQQAEVDATNVMSEFSEFDPDNDYEATAAWDHSSLASDNQFAEVHTQSMFSEANVDETVAEDRIDSDDVIDSEESAEPSDELPPSKTAGGEDSIEDYMNRLLQRVQGDDDPSSEMAETSTLTSTALQRELDEATVAEDSAPIDDNAPLIPRSQAPERDGSLSAMRELANHSARSAVSRSVRIQARDTQLKGFMKFLQAAVAMACAIACYFFLDWGFMIRSAMIAAILVIAGILAQEGWVLLADARRRMLIAEETAAGTSAESDFYEPIEGLSQEVDAIQDETPDAIVSAVSDGGTSLDQVETERRDG